MIVFVVSCMYVYGVLFFYEICFNKNNKLEWFYCWIKKLKKINV